ncbi:MAG: right-handed parallel beta-helix repeat-containing protein [bacterium]
MRRTWWVQTVSLGCVLVCGQAAGCGDDDGGDNGNNGNTNGACPAGHDPQGPACVPIFDSCPGPAAIPVLGGGCRAVGVTACATGFASDDAGGCDPILPAGPCEPGTMEVLGETACQPVGIPSCALGFVANGEWGCDAVLPPLPCTPGTMEVLGFDTCQPIGDCGTGPWGTITVDAGTVFVDAGYQGGASDGSQAAPFTTIAEGLSAAAPGAQVAVAAGTYSQVLTLNKPVRLRGRCAELVSVAVSDATEASVVISSGASQSVISDVTVTGGATGIVVNAAQDVQLTRLQILDTGRGGTWFHESGVSLTDVTVRRAGGQGIHGLGSSLTLDRVAVLDTRYLSDDDPGFGVASRCSDSGSCGTFTMTRSLVSGCRTTGVILGGLVSSIHGSVIRDTDAQPSDDLWGMGLLHYCLDATIACGDLVLTTSLLDGNTYTGVWVNGPPADLSSVEVRNTRSLPVDGTGGWGITSQCRTSANECGLLTVRDSLVTDNREAGIAALGVPADIRATVIRNTQAAANGDEGRGIRSQCYSYDGLCGELRLSDSLVENNRELGIMLGGTVGIITRTVVRDTQPQQSDGMLGEGIATVCFPFTGDCGRLELSRSIVSGNRAAGLLLTGVDATVTSTLIRDTAPRLGDLDLGWGIAFQCDTVLGVCGRLSVTGSVIDSNTKGGLQLAAGDATVQSTVVRDSLPAATGLLGRGIDAWCDPELLVCGTVDVSDSLVSGNHDLGVYASGMDATITGTIIRDTQPREVDGRFGRGIEANCSPITGECFSLTVLNSLITGNNNIGVRTIGIDAVLEGVSILDSRPNSEGVWQGEYGQGLTATCNLNVEECGSLELSGSRIVSSVTAGVSVTGVPGTITSSVVETVSPRDADQAFGYGIQVESVPGAPLAELHVDSCRITDAHLASILFAGGSGSLHRSQASGSQFAVVMNLGSSPTIGEDNQLSALVNSEPVWMDLSPAPSPDPSLPSVIE